MKMGYTFLLAMSLYVLLQTGAAAQSVGALTSAVARDAGKTSVAESEALSADELRSKIDQARQLLKSHADLSDGKTVALAVLDPQTAELHLLTSKKDLFLTKGAVLSFDSQLGRSLRLTVLRANGVNTAVNVTDVASGRTLIPLMVAYPIVRDGAVTEVAYYASAHPALVSPDTKASGEFYVSSMLDKAASNLSAQGIPIPSDIVDIAEHLCVVEHTDHKRFISEQHSELFPEILSLYALNQDNTFNYSVSTAGAGGMIQMIPRTYEAIRQQHANVTLQADFVTGMRNHANALVAMLLYMNDTWNKLQESSEVQDALRSGLATKPELLAAGYNSNPGRLPAYLKNGGAGWRSLIPAETQMYLSIYHSVDTNLRLNRQDTAASVGNYERLSPLVGMAIVRNTSTLMPWIDNGLRSSRVMFNQVLP